MNQSLHRLNRIILDMASFPLKFFKFIFPTKFIFLLLDTDVIKESEYLHLKSKALYFIPTFQSEAKSGLEKAVELNPNNSEAIRDLGVTFKATDIPKSIELYNKSLELNPKDKKTLGYLSIALRAVPTKTADEKK